MSRNQFKMKKIFKIFSLLLISSVVLTSCEDYGTEKNFNGVQLFYTFEITESEANSLGRYLIESEFGFNSE